MFVTFLNVPVLVISSLLGLFDLLPFLNAEQPGPVAAPAIEQVAPTATPVPALVVPVATPVEDMHVVLYVAPVATASPTATPRPAAPTATASPVPPTATPRQFPTNREVGILRPASTPTPVPYTGQKLSASVPSRIARWEPEIRAAAELYRLDPNLIAALMTTESNGNPDAVSGANAVGLLQIIDGPADPGANVLLGTKMLASNLHLFDDDLELALAAYNSGPRTVLRYKGVPPFAETQAHIQRTLTSYQKFRALS